jgi:hypothetical protein
MTKPDKPILELTVDQIEAMIKTCEQEIHWLSRELRERQNKKPKGTQQ